MKRLAVAVCSVVAAAALAADGPPVPPGPRFADATAASGIDFTHDNGAFGQKWLPETMGSGVVVFDADGDQRLDLLFLNGRNFEGKPGRASTQRLYLNRGGLEFADATKAAALDLSAYCLGGAAGDLDNDGDADLYLTCLGRDRLLRNDTRGPGAPRFADVSAEAGLAGTFELGASVALFDADRDGLLDVFATRYVTWSPEGDLVCSLDGKTKAYCTPQTYAGAPSRFYRNRGGLRFEDRTRAAGLHHPTAKSLGVVVLDLEADGWPDLAVANDTTPNFLFRNKKDGTFEEVGVSSGMALSDTGGARGGMGIDAGDFARSGRPGLVVGYFANEMSGLYRNEGNGLFMDVAPLSQFGRNTLLWVAWAAFFFDYDLDGWLDLFLANGHLDPEWERVQSTARYAQPQQLFRNEGKGRYVEVTGTAGGDLARPLVARGAAYGDLDDDGDLDLVVTSLAGPAKLFANRGPGADTGHWLRVRLVGKRSNRDGLGAVVEATAGGATQTWLAHTGGSYLSQSQVDPHFGLGAATAVEKLVVRWPSGAVSTLTNVKPDQRITVEEPASAE
ncbi:MAG TPA: CRTAC1 family protein [Thermoanaerobaculia bacterium]|nr:CRTAC1 family protein [Thermoanaerobaculia bacterium]